ncbi:DUF3100 domain-containing protein [Deefgea piscis]|uniref:DUF3100 domain-containing protein n=1 Tax=Deefgea piscis TaxID=2739061 RepID=UPI001C7E7A24|nr:DUF3100 domain-containing protein [Deefgea piscis]QZA82293.1 DUF3100 domain-containing protein [Deefgea piscis]
MSTNQDHASATPPADELGPSRSGVRIAVTSGIVAAIVIFIAQFIIGKQEIDVGIAKLPILPMLFAVMIGMGLSVNWTKQKVKAWGQIFTEKEENFCSKMVGICLLVLGTQYAGMIIPNLDIIVTAGIPLVMQELGNLLPIFIAIPLAVKFGFGRKAIGACSSISREPSIAVIQGRFGTGSPEYVGVLAIYLCGSVVGTLWFSILGSLGPLTGLNPLALAAGAGVGSGSMLSAASGALINGLEPQLAQQVLSIAAASNLLSSVLGALSLTYLGIPLAEFMYKFCNKKAG